MKKFILTFIAFISAIFVWNSSASAAHTMTAEEHKDFIRDINTVMENFIKDNKKTLRSIKGDAEGIIRYTSTFFKHNDEFDKEHGFDISDPDLTHCTKTFGEVTKLYYDHVLDHKAFAKQPLGCRGLSLFVLKYLNDRGVNCRYVKFRCKNPAKPTNTEPHEVITYSKDGQWFVCDLGHALTAHVIEKCGSPLAKLKCREIYGYKNSSDLLSVPCDIYQGRYLVNPKKTPILAIDILRIDRIGWHIFKFDDIKDKLACEVLDHLRHYDPLTDEEIVECYGTTREELEGKSTDEIRELFKRQLASKRK